MTKRVLLGLFTTAALLIGGPAQAQPLVTVTCSNVTVDFRTSIQPDSASVEIQSNAGTETHSVTLFQGGSDVVTFPLDGQSGEVVTAIITQVYRGSPTVTSATQTLADCPVPSPSPSPSPIVEPSPEQIVPTVPEPSIPPSQIQPTVNPDAISESPAAEEEAEPLEVSRVNTVPAELPRTGLDTLTLFFLAADSALLGLYLRRRAALRLRAFRRENEDVLG